jgi:hypothetical protein
MSLTHYTAHATHLYQLLVTKELNKGAATYARTWDVGLSCPRYASAQCLPLDIARAPRATTASFLCPTIPNFCCGHNYVI